MRDLIDIIAETLRDRTDRENVLLLVENLYFNDVRRSRWRRAMSASESTLIAHDIVNLQNSLDNSRSIKGITPKSELIKDALAKVSAEGWCRGIDTLPQVSPTQKDFFESEVLKPHRNYVTAVMLAELIRDERRRTKYNQWLTYLIPICTAIISAAAVVVANLWNSAQTVVP